MLKVGDRQPLLGPSSLLHWLLCNQQRNVGALPLHHHPLAHHHHLLHPPPPPLPLAPVLATLKAPAFLLNLRWP